jgi:hypothetical protein
VQILFHVERVRCYNSSVVATSRLPLHKLGASHVVAFGCFAALGHPLTIGCKITPPTTWLADWA